MFVIRRATFWKVRRVDPGGPFTTIASGPLNLPLNRNLLLFQPIDPGVHFHQTVGFPNSTAYTTYRVTFPTLRNAGAANSMQIAEVELLGSQPVITAGELFVDMDAATAAEGTLQSITNRGTLGGFFEARGGGATVPKIAFAGGTKGIQFDGGDYMQLVDSAGGALITAPAGLAGLDPTRSVEVWALNTSVALEETMVSWGKRGGPQGSTVSFGYGTSPFYGAVLHWVNPDIGWNDAGGAPATRRWHHLVYTYDGTTTRVYTNGVLANMEVLGTGVINTHSNTAINLAAQLEPDGVTPTAAFRGSLTIGRVRIHDGVLSNTAVRDNYNAERHIFLDPPPLSPEQLGLDPVHRYSFGEAASGNATGSLFADAIGAAHGTVRGSGATFTGTRLTLAGGNSAVAAYGDLPNGLLSSNGTNHGGAGEVSIEGWVRVTGNQNWSRYFDFGSTDIGGGAGGELTGPGGGGAGLDYLFYSAQLGVDVNSHRLELRNDDPTAGGYLTVEVLSPTFNTDVHFVVTWLERTGELKVYENGHEVATMVADARMSDINDVNNWLGRSNWTGDQNMQGEFNEFRIYGHVLTPNEVLGNFQRGPDTVLVAPVFFTVHPGDTNVCVGQTASFTVAWQGRASVQWQRRPPGGTFANIPGATSSTYVTPPAMPADDGAAYRAVLIGRDMTLTSDEALLGVIVAATPTVTYDFSSGVPSGTAVYGSAFVDAAAGVLELNPNVINQSGAFLTADLAPGDVVNGFTATFKVRMVPGTSPPADGFSFNWATDLPFGPFAMAEEGQGSGLSVCFDTYQNTGEIAPAIDVKWRGVVVAHTPVALTFLVTGTFADVQIRLNRDGRLDLLYNCSPIYKGLLIPGFTPQRGARFAFAGRTGLLRETHTIDDLALQLSIDPTSAPRITSVARQGPSGLIINGMAAQQANVALQASIDLVNWSWRAYLTPDINGAFQFVELDINAVPHSFYRLASAPQFPAGLVTWWRGEDNYADSFGPNHGSAFSNAGPTFVTGQRGHALNFNGTTEAMFIGGAPIPVPWTACFWVRRQDATEPSAALLTDPSTGLKLEQWHFTRRMGFTAFGVADYYFNYIMPVNVWTHLTFVSAPGATTIYANGTAVETNAATINLPLNILGVRENGLDHLQGQLDEITLFHRNLSPTEIQRVFNATRGP